MEELPAWEGAFLGLTLPCDCRTSPKSSGFQVPGRAAAKDTASCGHAAHMLPADEPACPPGRYAHTCEHAAAQHTAFWGRGEQKNWNLCIKNCVFILACLNFSPLESALYWMQSTYQDAFSTAQNSV